LKITVAQWFRPSGEGIQTRGVLADVVLPSLTDIVGPREADLDSALPFDRVKPLSFPKANRVNKEICDRLQAMSDQRCEQSAGFQELRARMLRLKKVKEEESTTLNEASFLQERAEVSADLAEDNLAEDKKTDAAGRSHRSRTQPESYFDEVLAITLDYVQLLGQTHVD
jgi:carboxyl-terminal processing protease